jgi:hypothetical protein
VSGPYLAIDQRCLGDQKGLARNFGEGLQALLQDAMQLWHAFHAREVADFVMEAPQL